MAQCIATNRRGTRCGRPAMNGATVCDMHGGKAPQVRAAAQRRLEFARREGELGRLLAEMNITTVDHSEGLMQAAVRTARTVGALEVLVAELDSAVTDSRPHPLVSMLGEWTDRQARVSKLALDAGVSEREIRLAEQLGSAIAGGFMRLLNDVELGLTAAQREVGRRLAGGILRELTVEAVVVEVTAGG